MAWWVIPIWGWSTRAASFALFYASDIRFDEEVILFLRPFTVVRCPPGKCEARGG